MSLQLKHVHFCGIEVCVTIFFHLIYWAFYLGTKLHIHIGINPLALLYMCVSFSQLSCSIAAAFRSLTIVGVCFSIAIYISRLLNVFFPILSVFGIQYHCSYQFVWTPLRLSISLLVDSVGLACSKTFIRLQTTRSFYFSNSYIYYIHVYTMWLKDVRQSFPFTSRTFFICMRELMNWEFLCRALVTLYGSLKPKSYVRYILIWNRTSKLEPRMIYAILFLHVYILQLENENFQHIEHVFFFIFTHSHPFAHGTNNI